MSKWKIGKEFNFEYGHMVYGQRLNAEYSIDSKCICKHPHGHSGKLIVFLEGDQLDDRGYFCDFKELNWFKVFLDDVLDHKMILSLDDPGLKYMVPGFEELKNSNTIVKHKEGYSIVNPDYFKTISEDRLIQILEGYVFVDFTPTSENIARWLQTVVQEKMSKIGVTCSAVQLFETVKSQATYFA